MGFTSGTHTSIATTTGSQCCLIMADKDGCISSQSTLCPILIQSVPNTPHTVAAFPHKPFSRVLQVFHMLGCTPISPLSSFSHLFCLAVYYCTNAKNTGCAPTGVLWESAADHCSPSRPNNYILSTNIRDSSHGTKAKTILSHASSLFLVSLSFCLSCFPFSIWLQLLIPRQRPETEYSAPSHIVTGYRIH